MKSIPEQARGRILGRNVFETHLGQTKAHPSNEAPSKRTLITRKATVLAKFRPNAFPKEPRTGKTPFRGKISPPCIQDELALARYARHASEKPRNQPFGNTPREDPARKGHFSLHGPLESRMARESCHSSQSNLEDRHNESIGRQNANPKKDPGTTAKSPNAKATLTRPLFLAARSNAQINLSPRRFPQGYQSSQHETISKTAQHQGSLEKSCLRKLIRRSSMST